MPRLLRNAESILTLLRTAARSFALPLSMGSVFLAAFSLLARHSRP